MIVKSYINGNFIKTKNIVKVYGPLKDHVGSFYNLTNKQINNAFIAARKAQKNWENLAIEKRINYIKKFIKKLDFYKEKIANIIVKEIGKPYKQSLREVERSIEIFLDTIEEYLKQYKIQINFKKENKKVTIIKKALGVISLIVPFNFPINLSISKIAPALITGNTIVIKVATNGTISASWLAKIADEIQLPKGVFNLITAKGKDIGNTMFSNKEINGLNLTGSIKSGIKASKESSMAIQVLELGGKSPAIVLKDADLELASDEIIKGAFLYSGQRCTAIKRVLVDEKIENKLIKLIVKKTNKLKVGPAIEDNDIVPLINDSAKKFVVSLIEDAKNKNAILHNKYKVKDNLVYPLIISNVNKNMLIYKKEQFGPILPIITFKTKDEAIKIANDTEYGLQASLFTSNVENIKDFYNIETGSLNINSSPQRSPDKLPFTGVKNSGLNIQGIKYSIESMTRTFNIVKKIN